MANYGLLQGLGDGLQQLGSQVFKAKFLDKLKEEETVRAEKRKEAQEAVKIKEQRYTQKDGVWYEQDVNSSGNVIDERLAPKFKVDEFQRQEQKEKISLDNLIASGDLTKKKLANYDEDRSLDLEERKARLDQIKSGAEENRAQAEYYRGGGSSGARATATAESASPEDYVQELMKQSEGLKQQYTKGKSPKLTSSEFEQAARAAVMEGAKRGQDPRSIFAETLRLFESQRAKKYTRGARGLEEELTDDEL